MLKLNKLDMLINEKDGKGFTPLHWATSNFHPKVVSTLTWDKRVKLEIMNNEGLTALDIAEKNIDSEAPFRKRLTLTALKSANAPRSERGKRQREMVLVGEEWEKSSRKSPDLGRVNTLLLVASLVATVTYACGFTLPGGNNDSDPDPGMATLVRKLAFQFHF
uniref:PGG domain-containing protein n=1 Tax=Rhizophora mucronata TaxID=61149 RepID=A0A2P2QLC7_RHIMU